MTIVAIHFTETNILAIADGLISRSGCRVLEEDQKIVKFTPEYKIPLVSLGKFNGFNKYIGGDFCLAYAGNFSLASTIQKRFISIVTEFLAIDRQIDNGKPTILQREDHYIRFRPASYCDDFNFNNDELIPITVDFLVDILQNVAKQACFDFRRNAMIEPDVQFLLFGEDIINNKIFIRAQILKNFNIDHPEFYFERYSLLPWSLACIGNSTQTDLLINDIESSAGYNGNSNIKTYSDPMEWLTTIEEKELRLSARESIIKNKVLTLIKEEPETIGGDCLIASKRWANHLQLKTIKKSDIQLYIK